MQLQGNKKVFVAGQTISGVVHVDLRKQLFPVKHLKIGLLGEEEVFFIKD